MTHTKGPWKFEDHVELFIITACADESDYIADVHKWIIPGSDTETSANARLIAAAPSLLAALILAVDQIETDYEVTPLDGRSALIRKLRTEIESAGG